MLYVKLYSILKVLIPGPKPVIESVPEEADPRGSIWSSRLPIFLSSFLIFFFSFLVEIAEFFWSSQYEPL